MAPLKSLAFALAVSVFAVAVFTTTAAAAPANQVSANANAKEKLAKRNAYLIKVMKSHGFSEWKAKRVVVAITRYERDFRVVHQDMMRARVALADDKTANDKAAQARVDADKKS